MIDFSRNYFDLFGLPAAFRFDAAALDRAYRQLQTEVHPDRFAGGSDAEKRLAQQSSARVNLDGAGLARARGEERGGARIEDDEVGIEARRHVADAVGETDTALPREFLERQLERREQAHDAQAAGDVRTLSSLLADARADAGALEDVLVRMLDHEKAFAVARMRVRELTFLVKLAEDMDAMLASVET